MTDSNRPTLARAVLDKARALEAQAVTTIDTPLRRELTDIALDLRVLAREYADTEDPDPEGEPAQLPDLRHPGPLPEIEDT